MVNCGGIDCGSEVYSGNLHPTNISTDGSWIENPAMKALSEAFTGQVSHITLIRFELDYHKL